MLKFKLKSGYSKNIQDRIKKDLINNQFIKEIQKEIVDNEIKKSMLSGLSPVKGFRRFVAYTNPDKYPGKRKPKRPVNLKLSGDMIDELKAWAASASSFFIGISKLASEKIKTYAKANNEGTDVIPARRFIPIRGETYNVTITRKIKDVIAKRLAKIINK